MSTVRVCECGRLYPVREARHGYTNVRAVIVGIVVTVVTCIAWVALWTEVLRWK